MQRLDRFNQQAMTRKVVVSTGIILLAPVPSCKISARSLAEISASASIAEDSRFRRKRGLTKSPVSDQGGTGI